MHFIIFLICTIVIFLLKKTTVAVLEPLLQSQFRTSLCLCVMSAGRKYFEEKETVTVALPLTDYTSNVSSIIPSTQILLSLLTKEMIWPIITKNMMKPTDRYSHTYSLEKASENYIIFVRNTGEIINNLRMLKNSRSWNPHARFMVISATLFQNPYSVAEGILQALWEEKLLNGVLLLANRNNTNVFDVYTTKPYQNKNCGSSLGKIKKIDSCRMGKYKHHRDLFEDKIPNKLDNCSIIAGFVNVAPMVINMENNSIGLDEYYSTKHGIEINLLNMIASFLGLKVIYRETETGEIYLNGSSYGSMSLLKEDKLDILLGSYVKTLARSYYFDATITYIQDELVWCVPHIPILTQSQNLLDIIDTLCWILIVFLYFGIALLMWICGRRLVNDFKTYKDCRNIFQYIFSILIAIPVKRQPKTTELRALFMLIVIFGFYLDTLYQTYLTSILAGSNYTEEYSSVDDIYKNGLQTYFIPNADRYFEDDSNKNIRDKIIECKNYQKCMDYVAIGRNTAFCVPQLYVDYIYNSYVTKSNVPLLYCFGKVVSMSINMLMRKGFPLFDKIDRLITRVSSGGFITKWQQDILRTRAGNFVSYIDIDEGKGNVLQFGNLVPIFVLLIVGHTIGVVVFVIEVQWYKWRSIRGGN